MFAHILQLSYWLMYSLTCTFRQFDACSVCDLAPVTQNTSVESFVFLSFFLLFSLTKQGQFTDDLPKQNLKMVQFSLDFTFSPLFLRFSQGFPLFLCVSHFPQFFPHFSWIPVFLGVSFLSLQS